MNSSRKPDETVVKSYRYLRLAMVALVFCLAVAIGHQSWRQGAILGSISAYYFTPAQTIFVGVLISIGVCMIAIRGTTDEDDVLLNIAGMLAPIVAVVPTARDEDYVTIVRTCRESNGFGTPDGEVTAADCLGVAALAEATAADIENNMVALLAVGLVGLVATVLLARRERFPVARFWAGFSVAVGLYLLALTAFVWHRQAFIDLGHYAAAIPMFGCIVAVVVINALRHKGVELGSLGPMAKVRRVLAALFRSPDGYALVAQAMVIAVVVGGVLAWAGTYETTIFWLEAALIVLFAVFWSLQTREWLDRDPSADRAGHAAAAR